MTHLIPHPSRSPYVLVVDDDADLREALVDLLLEEGIAAGGADDGRTALAHWPRPDVVLLDLDLPALDGRGYLAVARALGERADVILMSGSLRLLEIAREEGLSYVLAKPFVGEHALRLVRGLLRDAP